MTIAKLTKAEAKELDLLIAAFNAAQEALYQHLDEIASVWEDEIADKSEKWSESNAGLEAANRAQTMRAWFDECPEPVEYDVKSLTGKTHENHAYPIEDTTRARK